MPPRDYRGSHTSLNPYSKKSGFPFLAEETNKKNLCFPLCWAPNLLRNKYFKIYFTKYMIMHDKEITNQHHNKYCTKHISKNYTFSNVNN